MNEMIDKIFSRLDQWKNYPAYRLERRTDIFFALYLEEILKSKYGVKIDLIIPEFPVRIGNIYPKNPNLNKSFKIDYLAVAKKSKQVFLIELKTDMTSRREIQDWYLIHAKEINIPGLVDGILSIYRATRFKKKYDYLIKDLEALEWIKRKGRALKNVCSTYNITITYIQPVTDHSDADIICFDDIINLLRNKKDDLSRRFAESLVKWKPLINPTLLD